MDIQYQIEKTETSFSISALVPAQLLLMPEWEQLVWDETLRQADADGVMLVGPVHVTAESYMRGANQPKRTGEAKPFPPEPAYLMDVADSDIVCVRGEAMIGVSL